MSEVPPAIPDSAEHLAASLRYHGRPDTSADTRVVRRNKPQRVARAIQAWLACWGLAVVAVFVPVLHFVLVPALFVGGPLLGFQRLGERMTVLATEGPCPGCGAPGRFVIRQPARASMPLRCEACGRAIALVLPAAALADAGA